MTINEMNLEPVAKSAAEELIKKYPKLTFTSGKRSVSEQASAMASNIISSKNRKWIEETYAASGARDKLQTWVNNNKSADTKSKLAAGLKGEMNKMTAAELSHISKHLSGLAFDVQPVTDDAEVIKKFIKNLKGATKFLDNEGGLVRWHVQF
jgi:hypothetical protein